MVNRSCLVYSVYSLLSQLIFESRFCPESSILDGTKRVEWIETGAMYNGFPVQRPLLKTQGNESAHSTLGYMLDGENNCKETATAVHLETVVALRRETQRKRDLRESGATASGTSAGLPPPTNNRTDVALDLIATHRSCPVLGRAPFADPLLTEVTDEDTHIFLWRDLGSLEPDGLTKLGAIVQVAPAPNVVGRRRPQRIATATAAKSSTGVDGSTATAAPHLAKRSRVDMATSSGSSAGTLLLLPAHPEGVPKLTDASFKYPCTCAPDGAKQPGESAAARPGKRAHASSCPRHKHSAKRRVGAPNPVHGEQLSVTFQSELGNAFRYNSLTKQWEWASR